MLINYIEYEFQLLILTELLIQVFEQIFFRTKLNVPQIFLGQAVNTGAIRVRWKAGCIQIKFSNPSRFQQISRILC